MSNIVGFKNEFGRIIAHSLTLEKHASKLNLTPIFEEDPDALELREVLTGEAVVVEVEDVEPAKAKPTAKRRSITQ
jgi:hypothetical protein